VVAAVETETDSAPVADASDESRNIEVITEAASGEEEVLTGSIVDDELTLAADIAQVSRHQVVNTAGSGPGLQSPFSNNALRNPFMDLMLGSVTAPGIPAVPTLLASEIHTLFTASEFVGDLDRIRDTTNEAINLEQQLASIIVISTGLSIGYVSWLIRSGLLMNTALSSLPVWHFVDPLPVLGSIAAGNAVRERSDADADSIRVDVKRSDSVCRQSDKRKGVPQLH
jgi:hypothetical protein